MLNTMNTVANFVELVIFILMAGVVTAVLMFAIDALFEWLKRKLRHHGAQKLGISDEAFNRLSDNHK